jgi:hypothetical protein
MTWSIGELGPQVTCLPKVMPTCANGRGICEFGISFDTNRSWDATIPRTLCNGVSIDRQVSGRTVPEFCTYANSEGAVVTSVRIEGGGGGNPAAGCEGRCFECESTNFAVNQTTGLPRSCSLLRPVPGGGICVADNVARQVQQLDAQARAVASGMGANPHKPSSTRCGPANDRGLRQCITCDNGVCKDTVAIDWLTPTQDDNTRFICGATECAPGTDHGAARLADAEPKSERSVASRDSRNTHAQRRRRERKPASDSQHREPETQGRDRRREEREPHGHQFAGSLEGRSEPGHPARRR